MKIIQTEMGKSLRDPLDEKFKRYISKSFRVLVAGKTRFDAKRWIKGYHLCFQVSGDTRTGKQQFIHVYNLLRDTLYNEVKTYKVNQCVTLAVCLMRYKLDRYLRSVIVSEVFGAVPVHLRSLFNVCVNMCCALQRGPFSPLNLCDNLWSDVIK